MNLDKILKATGIESYVPKGPENFEKDIFASLDEINEGKGKVSENYRKFLGIKITILEKDLEEEIAKENYELAEKLKNEIEIIKAELDK